VLWVLQQQPQQQQQRQQQQQQQQRQQQQRQQQQRQLLGTAASAHSWLQWIVAPMVNACARVRGARLSHT
jgi:hypothetical protein